MRRELSLATWNCFGQAQGALDAITAARAPYAERFHDDEVRRVFTGLHVVCMQELLSGDAQAFFDALGSQRVRDRNSLQLRPLTVRGSGLGIAAHHPIAMSGLHTFSCRSAGWDRLARKGTLHARVSLDGIEVDVLNVHLQSGYDPLALAARAAQLEEVGRRVAELGSDDRPFIVCGDFNVDGLTSTRADYAALRRTLEGFDDLGARDDLPTFDPHPERNSLAHEVEPHSPTQRLDYIFVRTPRARNMRLRAAHVARVLDRPLSTHRIWRGQRVPTYASDHFALVATLEIERTG